MAKKPTVTLQELEALAPWHYNIRINDQLKTRDANTGVHAHHHVINPQELMSDIKKIYPDGLQGKSFMDAACNSGAYCFIARKMGASETFGFDVREQWIRQANFLKERLPGNSDILRFEVCDLLDLDRLLARDKKFDICLFKGIFYHLPDPVAGLKLVADRTSEVIIVDSDTTPGQPDGYLKLITEGTENPMSGVHRLAWLPTGPAVIEDILKWLGFEETLTLFWRNPGVNSSRFARGRVRVVGARRGEFLQALTKEVSSSPQLS